MYRTVSNCIEVYRMCIVIFDISLSIQYRDTFCSIHFRYKHDTFLAPSGLRYCIVFRYHFDTHSIHLGYCIVISDRYRPEGCCAIENTVGSASQGYHTDYAHSQVGHLHGTPWYPRSAIWAALAAFEIGVRDGRVIRVPRDHVIFFMADFWHCGGPGLSPEPRFHGFQLASWTQIPTGVYT